MLKTKITVFILLTIQLAPCAKISVLGIVIAELSNVVEKDVFLVAIGGKQENASTIFTYTVERTMTLAILVTKVIL